MGISKENLKFIYDPPEPMYEKFEEEVITKQKDLIQGSNWEGIFTKDHHPSRGEWERLLKESSLFVYFSLTCLLHRFQPGMIAEASSISNSNCAIIFDRMNSYKPLIDKEVLTSVHFQNQEQPTQTAALFSILGLNTVVLNQWALTPEENLNLFKTILEETGGEGTYVAAGLRKYKEGEKESQLVENEGEQPDEMEEKVTLKKAIFRFNTINYGVALNRII